MTSYIKVEGVERLMDEVSKISVLGGSNEG
jgi:hypothetical protein